MSTTNQYTVHIVRVSDNLDFGYWQSMDQIQKSGTTVTTRDAYGLDPKVLGGTAAVQPFSCTKTFYPDSDTTRDLLEPGVMKDFFWTTKQKLDTDGNTIGKPKTRLCLLTSYSEAAVDVGTDSPEVDTYSAEFTPTA